MADPDGDSSGADPTTDGFGYRGWLLVGAVFAAFVVVPAIIYLRPPGLPFAVSYLVLPLAPAVILALLAVWITT